MSVFVVDASVVVKWFVPEVRSEAARRWLTGSHEYLAPDLLLPEAANAVWTKVQRRELTAVEAQRLIVDLSRVGIETVTMQALLPDAAALALNTGVTVYDAMYLALAVRLDTEVISDDDRLTRRLAGHPLLERHVRRVEDFTD